MPKVTAGKLGAWDILFEVLETEGDDGATVNISFDAMLIIWEALDQYIKSGAELVHEEALRLREILDRVIPA